MSANIIGGVMPIQNYHLTFRSGPNPGKVYPLEKQELFIGRDLSNDIPVPDPEISRRHARLLLQPDGVFIEDLGSTNGTFINGMRISSPQALHVGDVITLAENIVMLLEADAYDADATVVGGQAYTVAANVQPPTPPQPAYQPKPPHPAPQQAVPQYTPPPAQPVQPAQQYAAPQKPAYVPPAPAPAPVYSGQAPAAPKKRMATWLIVLLIVLAVSCVIIALILTFMPASWWCALTFNQLPGCPIY